MHKKLFVLFEVFSLSLKELKVGQQKRGYGYFTASARFCVIFNHMCLPCLLTVVGTGTSGRVLPLPPDSIEPLFVTRHGGETKQSLTFSLPWCHVVSTQ